MIKINKIIYPQGIFSNPPLKNPDVKIWHNPPNNPNDPGEEGWTAYDENYHYIYTSGSWKRQPITKF
jgi:hypothetical protein